MGKGVYGAVMKLLRVENVPCSVTGVWDHSPTMKAVRVSCPELIHAHHPEEGEYIRCWFPYPEQPSKEGVRGYTLTDIDYDSGEFTLLVLLHSPAGPACSWMKNAKIGDVFEASYYGSTPFRVPETQPEGFVLVADAAGIPNVNAMIDQLAPDFPVKVWLLDWDAADHAIPLHTHPIVSVEWVEPNATALVDKARAFSWEGWFPHLVCESKILLALRRYLRKEAGIPKDFMYSRAYWIRGKSMGTDRD